MRANDHFRGIVDHEARELESKLARDFTHPDDLETEAAHLEALRARHAASFSIEKRLRRKDRRHPWARDDDYSVVMAEDISERKLAERRQWTLRAADRAPV